MRLAPSRWLSYVAFSSLFLVVLAAPVQAQATGTITGAVLASGSEASIAGAQIGAQGTNRLTISDVNGRSASPVCRQAMWCSRCVGSVSGRSRNVLLSARITSVSSSAKRRSS